MKQRKTPQLGRSELLKIGQLLRSYYETRIFSTPDPKLDSLALVADAKLREKAHAPRQDQG